MGKRKIKTVNNIPPGELPVMKECCKTCPFKEDKHHRQRDPQLAATVTERTLFKGWQSCHSAEKGDERIMTKRCKGSYDTNMTIYSRMDMRKYDVK